MARSPNPTPTPQTLTLTLLLLLLLTAASSSPAPAPAPLRTPPEQVTSYSGAGGGATPHALPHHHHHHGRRRAPPPPPQLNFGEKLGIAFAGVAVAMQVGLAAFLVARRWQLRRLEKAEVSSSTPLT